MSESYGPTEPVSVGEVGVAAAWDANSVLWVPSVRGGQDKLREDFNSLSFRDFLPNLVGHSVLDLGCGEGYYSRLLARMGAKVTGIDLSAKMIAAARELERDFPLGIDYRTGSAVSYQFRENSFDDVISAMALMCAPNLSQLLAAVFRVLRPGGTFCFSVAHPCFWTKKSTWVSDPLSGQAGLLVSSYFATEPYIDCWQFENAQGGTFFRAPRFPYQMQDYVNGLVSRNFIIRRMCEPCPSAAMIAEHPWLAKLREHVPVVMFVEASKNSEPP